jgi:hypothetical protein
MPTSLFFSHNEALVPPYRVIVDTNFINLSLENRMDLVKGMMDVLYAKGASSHSVSLSSNVIDRRCLYRSQPFLAFPTVSSLSWRS